MVLNPAFPKSPSSLSTSEAWRSRLIGVGGDTILAAEMLSVGTVRGDRLLISGRREVLFCCWALEMVWGSPPTPPAPPPPSEEEVPAGGMAVLTTGSSRSCVSTTRAALLSISAFSAKINRPRTIPSVK